MKMIKDKKGQVFAGIIIFLLVLFMFIFAAPVIFEFVGIGVASTGTATGFIIKAFPWVMFFAILAVGLRIVTSGGEFF